ncbi:MAG: hypothetical protein SFX73_34855 [Kofleriaceae bacterium]|nr:hypothetical protein [Kofleriaceae bacterium]
MTPYALVVLIASTVAHAEGVDPRSSDGLGLGGAEPASDGDDAGEERAPPANHVAAAMHEPPAHRAAAEPPAKLVAASDGTPGSAVDVDAAARADERRHSLRFELGLGGPSGYGAIRYVARVADRFTIEPAVGYGASGLGVGAIVALQLRKADGPDTPLKTRRVGWRLYGGASVARTLVEPETSIDVPEGTYAWIDFGAYWHGRLTDHIQIVGGVNMGVLVASPDLEGIGEGDDDFPTIGFLGTASWWIKEGFAPGFWGGLQF